MSAVTLDRAAGVRSPKWSAPARGSARSPMASCPRSAPAISSRRSSFPFSLLSLAALGLNLLTGYAGQVSLGSAAFMAVGAFTAYNFAHRVPGLPLIATLIAGRPRRGRDRHRVRAAEPAASRLLSRGVDAGGAVLRPMGADEIRLVLQLQSVRGHRRASAAGGGTQSRQPDRPLSLRLDHRRRRHGADLSARRLPDRPQFRGRP